MRQTLEHLDQLLPLIEEKDEIILIDKDTYQVVDYVYLDKNTFDHPLLHECRGIKFDMDGKIIARPFHKFFNLGEKVQEYDVDWSAEHITMLKLDGSMIHTALLDDKVVAMTRKGHTDIAKDVQELFFQPGDAHYDFALDAMELGCTPIFEYTSPTNRIVIQYDAPMLTLLAVRDMKTGEYLNRRLLELKAALYHVPVVRKLYNNARDLIITTRKIVGEEGIVVQFDDGHMLKIKADDYVRKHRVLDDLGSKKKVLAVVFAGGVDDIIPILDAADQKELLTFRDEVNLQVAKAVEGINAFHHHHRAADRKDYAAFVKETITDAFRVVAFAAYDKKDVRQSAMQAFTRNQDLINAKWRGE